MKRQWVRLIAALIKPYAGIASSSREVERFLARHQRNHPPQVENIRAVLDPDQARLLLITLCEKLGYCLPPQEQERIASNPPLTVFEFAEAVFVGDGEDPAAAEKKILNDVRTLVAAAFAKSRLNRPDDET